MPAIARITTYGRNYWRDRERLVECLRNGDPFYMASVTGGPVTPDMNPSVGQMMGRHHRAALDLVGHLQAGCVDYIVWSYETPIAYHCPTTGWTQPDVKYSRTTTNHQSIIAVAISKLEAN